MKKKAETVKVEYRQAPNITREPCAWIYRLGNRKIYVEKQNGRLFIRNKEGGKDFMFWDSDPKVVEAIANLLLEASKK